jgi:hypothetical protein
MAMDEAEVTHKISFVVFFVLQFPVGLLFGLLTGNYNNGLFAAFLNPLLIGWALQKVIFKCRRVITQKLLLINYTVWTLLVLTALVYVVTE